MKEKSQNCLYKLNKIGLIIALVHWVISFFTDHLVFEYVQWDFSNSVNAIKTIMTYGAKLVFLALLIFIWQYVFYIIKNTMKKKDKVFLYTSLSYFCVNLVLVLLTWPGIWRMDEFGILNSAKILIPVFWQNYLTSLFYVFSMMLIPMPTGVIIVQCLIISLVVGYIISFMVKKCGKIGYLSFIPFVFLPVLDSNLYPMRMSLYAFLELLLIVLVYETYSNVLKKPSNELTKESAKSFDLVPWIKIGLLGAVVTSWRTEAIYYILLFPVLLWILFHKTYTKKTIGKIVLIYLCFSLCLFAPQKIGEKLSSGNQYDLTSVVLPLAPMVETAYEDSLNGDKEASDLLDEIDKVVDVKITYDGVKEGKSGINLFWGAQGFQKEGYTDEDYRNFKSSYYKLILKYPNIFLKERFNCFLTSKDLLQNTTELFTAKDVLNYETFKTYSFVGPINNDVRTTTISFLECRNQDDYTVKNSNYGVVYSHIIPIIILLLLWAVCLAKKKWTEFFLISLPLVKVPLIFITAPSRLFMYYYSLYLMGYFVLFALIVMLVAKVWKRVGGPVSKTIRYAKRNGIKAAYYAAKERTDHVHVDELTRKTFSYVGSKEESDYLLAGGNTSDVNDFSYNPLISIVVPTYETKPEFLIDLLNSVKNQIYENWELVLADASKSELVKKTLEEESFVNDIDSRIRYIKLEKNDGISNNTNVAIDEAKGEYIALLDHDDLITKDALYHMVKKLNENIENKDTSVGDVVAIYSNEDKCNSDASIFYEPYFKPDFNLDLLQSNNYICHFLLVKADVMKELKLRSEYDGAQDYDLILRLSERGKLQHIPYVIYHWRCHEGSTAVNTDSKRYAYDAGLEALKAHFDRIGLSDKVSVSHSSHLGFYEVTYQDGIFDTRKDVAAICGRVIENDIVVGSPDSLFDGLKFYSSGYMHRADLYLDVTKPDERALKIRDDLGMSLEDALSKGMLIVYDPHFVVR